MSAIDKKTKDGVNKISVHQIINLDEGAGFNPSIEQDFFVADLAHQCGNLLNWVTDSNSQLLGQSLWKNQMRMKACEKFPDLDPDEIRKLVDRDWRIMNQEHRKAALSTFKTIPDPNDLQNRASNLRQKILALKTRRNNS